MFFDLWNFLKYQSVFIYLIFDRGILVGKRKFLLINDQRIIVILPTKMMKKTIVLYIRYGRRYIILTIACLSLACLTILKSCDNSIRFDSSSFPNAKFLFFNRWICKCKFLTSLKEDESNRWNDYSTRKVEEIFALIDCVGKIEISRKINRSGKPLRDVVVVTANINLLNELQDVRNLSLIHRNWFTDTS